MDGGDDGIVEFVGDMLIDGAGVRSCFPVKSLSDGAIKSGSLSSSSVPCGISVRGLMPSSVETGGWVGEGGSTVGMLDGFAVKGGNSGPMTSSTKSSVLGFNSVSLNRKSRGEYGVDCSSRTGMYTEVGCSVTVGTGVVDGALDIVGLVDMVVKSSVSVMSSSSKV